MSYIAIVSNSLNRITKFQPFKLEADANDHVVTYGGFVYNNTGNIPIPDIFISGETVTEVSRVSLESYKENAIAVNQAEAGSRIAALFNTSYGSENLRDKQINDLMRYNELREKETDTTMTRLEQTEIDELRTKKDNIKAIRTAENIAATSINAAANKAAVDAISVSWP